MTSNERVILLVGSPKGLDESNSARVGQVVAGELEAMGWHCDTFRLATVVQDEGAMIELVKAVDLSDLVIVSTPLYVDSLPAPVIQALHQIVEARRDAQSVTVPRFFSIVNCGFVEPWQNQSAQHMLQQFCSEARLEWVGALSMGAAGAMNRHIRRAFRLVVEALHEEIIIPEEVQQLTRYRIMPAWLYVFGGNVMWRKIAKQNGALPNVKAQPYGRDSLPTG